MTGANVKENEILDNPLVRNAVHLIGTICLGYILLRLLLYILDATQIGFGWLEANQDSSILVIILISILIISFLIIDACFSLVRRRLGDMKYSAVENGISLAREGIRRSDELPGLVKHWMLLVKTNIQRADELPGLMKDKARILASTAKKIGNKKSTDQQKTPVRKEMPTPQRIKITSYTEPEPKSNIKFSDSVQLLLKEDLRVIKAFDSEHSISIIDFKSRINKKDVTITIELLKEHSAMAEPVKEGLVYEYNNIWINVPDDVLDKAVIRFKVDRQWIANNEIQDLWLEQFFDGRWDVMKTRRIGHDAQYRFYEVNVPYFSVPFAIVGN